MYRYEIQTTENDHLDGWEYDNMFDCPVVAVLWARKVMVSPGWDGVRIIDHDIHKVVWVAFEEYQDPNTDHWLPVPRWMDYADKYSSCIHTVSERREGSGEIRIVSRGIGQVDNELWNEAFKEEYLVNARRDEIFYAEIAASGGTKV